MGLHYEDLDDEVRQFMLEEIEMDAADDKIYLSAYLTQQAQGEWSDYLREAARSGSDDTLAAQLKRTASLNSRTLRQSSKGRVTPAKVPYNAAQVLAESEFNRYYVRGLCRKAIAHGIDRLEVYRAKSVGEPRPDSRYKIGLLVEPEVVLMDIRNSSGAEPAFGIPSGPGSGLSVRIRKS